MRIRMDSGCITACVDVDVLFGGSCMLVFVLYLMQ